MFSCAKSGPLSGSGCEGTEKKNTEAHAQVNEGEEEEERKRERRKKRGGEETLLSRSAAFPFFFLFFLNVCVSLNGEHSADTKGSEGKQCRLTRHHWLIISNLSRA